MCSGNPGKCWIFTPKKTPGKPLNFEVAPENPLKTEVKYPHNRNNLFIRLELFLLIIERTFLMQ